MPRSPLTEQYQRVMSLVEQLHALEPDERNFILDLLVPEPEPEPAPKKSTKAPTKERKIEKCEACNFTRRAARHQDVDDPNYHEFVKAEKKSARASSLQRKIQGTAGKNDGLCAYRDAQGNRCAEEADYPIHDPKASYGGYHPFVRPVPPAARLSAANGGAEGSTANSETEKETVSSAGAGD